MPSPNLHSGILATPHRRRGEPGLGLRPDLREALSGHKAAVLLDRIADVYPEMDYYPLGRLGFQHSHGGSLRGRITGCISECFTGEGHESTAPMT